MDRKKKFFAEDVTWDNPIKECSYLLYLSDEIFPHDPRLKAYKESLDILTSFYSKDRIDHGANLKKLRSFLRAPNEQLLVIEGPVGVGKSWFVRYNLHFQDLYPVDAGVIDLLRAAPDDAEGHIYKQVCPIIEAYLTNHFSSPASALKKFAEEKYRLRYGVQDASEQQPRVHAGAAKWVESWLSLEEGKGYADILLQAIESLGGPFLFLVIDNVDRVSDTDQERLVAIVQRVLRNVRVRLIVPLRDTTPLLIDRFRGLNEVRHESMTLSQINIESMFRPRFHSTRDGNDLNEHKIADIEHQEYYTFPEIYKLIFKSETGSLIRTLSGGNCRVALHMTRHLLESNQLKAIRNISNPQFAIAALMLLDTSKSDPGSYIINLFDNKERGEEGNALIRYRVLELFAKKEKINLNDQRTKNYFVRLGYPPQRIRLVVSRLMMASLLHSSRGYTPEELLRAEDDNLGSVIITKTGEAYQTQLLDKMWYYVAAKIDLAPNMPSKRQSYDQQKNYYYITKTNFVAYLKDEEKLERSRAKRWDSEHGPKYKKINLICPSIKAKAKLFQEENRGTNS
ncbi:MAG: hypothetical protein D3924_04540 [Candidatus Electrothrix sp. AR4]|nr:hypothetical protein [Candidatus Electrothrix sp. AR4]